MSSFGVCAMAARVVITFESVFSRFDCDCQLDP